MRQPSLRLCMKISAVFHSLVLTSGPRASVNSFISFQLIRLGGFREREWCKLFYKQYAPQSLKVHCKIVLKIFEGCGERRALLHWLQLISRNNSCEKRLNLRSTVHRIQGFCESLWWVFPSIRWYLDENNPEMWHVADITEMERSELN